MSIDWLTVAAQVLNFLVLVWLLRRFLYEPVTRAMARREQGIAERLSQAAAREREAEERKRDYGERLAEIERTRRERLAEIEREAEHERSRLVEAARHGVEKSERNWREALSEEQREFLAAIRDELGSAVRHAAGRCLAELADASLEDRAIERLVARLRGLGEDDRRALREAEWLVLACAHEPSPERCAHIESRLREALDATGAIRFEHAPQLVLGVELRSPAMRVQWSAAEYLREAEQGIRARLAAAQGEREVAARGGGEPRAPDDSAAAAAASG